MAKPSYLYGTIHLMPEKDFFIAQDALACLKSSSSLMLEVDMDMSIKDQLKLAQRMVLPKGKTMKDYMDASDYQKLYVYLSDSVGLGESKIESYMKIKPLFLMSIVFIEYYENIKVYEQEFTQIAKNNDLNLQALETIDEQLNIIEKMGLDMEMPVGDDINFIADYERLKSQYMAKDLEGLYTVIREEMDSEQSKYAHLEAQLLTDRNNNWIPVIDSLVNVESTFIAVGAAHLAGKEGLINLLREKGYGVELINQSSRK